MFGTPWPNPKGMLKKILGMIYFFLAGIAIFLALYPPKLISDDVGLRYFASLILFLVSLVLIIKGYLKLTEDETAYSGYSTLKW